MGRMGLTGRSRSANRIEMGHAVLFGEEMIALLLLGLVITAAKYTENSIEQNSGLLARNLVSSFV